MDQDHNRTAISVDGKYVFTWNLYSGASRCERWRFMIWFLFKSSQQERKWARVTTPIRYFFHV